MIDVLAYEELLLSSMMQGRDAALMVIDNLTRSMFVSDIHRALFSRIERLCEGGLELEPELLCDSLTDTWIDPEYQGVRLEDVRRIKEQMHSAANVEHWAEVIRCLAVVRKVHDFSGKEINTIDELFAVCERLQAVNMGRKVKVPKITDFDDYTEVEGMGGVESGFLLIDDNTDTCGLPRGQFTVIAAYAKGGKTACMVQMADQISRDQKHVVYATFADLDKAGIAKRRLKNYCGWSKRPDAEHLIPEYEKALRRLRGNGYFHVFDATGGDVPIESLVSRLRGLRYTPDVVFIDYAQELTTIQRVRDDLQCADITSRVIRDYAQESGVAVVVGSQITEGKDGGRDITKGSRKWIERAGLVLQLDILDDARLEKMKQGKDKEFAVNGATKAEITYSRFGLRSSGWWAFVGNRVRFDEL